MQLSAILRNLKNISHDEKSELNATNITQWLNTQLKIGVWKVDYSYICKGETFKGMKYIMAGDMDWDTVDVQMMEYAETLNDYAETNGQYIEDFTIESEIFMGEYVIDLE